MEDGRGSALLLLDNAEELVKGYGAGRCNVSARGPAAPGDAPCPGNSRGGARPLGV